MKKSKEKIDIAIVGGGPAGMMAAIWAARAGARVILVEKNAALGKKLLLCGGGRCNFTNTELDQNRLVERYGANGRFLHSALSVFGPEDVIRFFADLGVESKSESSRIFPTSDKSSTILDALTRELNRLGVMILLGSPVRSFIKKDDVIESVVLVDGKQITADRFIITVGGKSFPATGSTGDGYDWLASLGHRVITPRPALASINVCEKWFKGLSGVSVKNARLIAKRQGKKIGSSDGEILFTHSGLSGPAAINLTGICELGKGTELTVDFFPSESEDNFFDQMKNETIGSNTLAKNLPVGRLPQRLVVELLKSLDMDIETPISRMSHKEIRHLASGLKNVRLAVESVAGFESAMVTAGGADIAEIDPRSMRSKIVDNLYLAGEVIDVHGLTGGFNLQACWSTGRLAGESAAHLKNNR